MAFDSAGNLYVAHYGHGRVDVLAPDGTQILEIPVPGKGTTNCAFGGPDRRTLVITDVDSASLYSVRLSIPGHPLYYETGTR
jgi:gluconolactonase